MHAPDQEFIRLMKHPLKFRLFLFLKVPSAFFSGVRIREVDNDHCTVSVPYKWFSQNPFKSVYFACLAMAAELSTGALAMTYVHKRQPRISMLVTGLRAAYFKKATGITRFTCDQGEQFRQTIQQAIDSGQPQQITAKSVGKNQEGELVAEFFIEWSFKAKK